MAQSTHKFICSLSDLIIDASVRQVKKKFYRYKASEWNTRFPLEPCESKNFEVIKHTLKKGRQIGRSKSSFVEFDDDVTFTILKNKDIASGAWMSDTPMEIESHRPAIKEAKGHVLVAGLGMGYVAYEMAKKKSVKKITVVEYDPEIIELIYPRMEAHFQGKVEVVCKNIFTYQPNTKFDSIWFDIWRTGKEFAEYRPALIDKYHKHCDPDRMRFWDQRRVKLKPASKVLTNGIHLGVLEMKYPHLFKEKRQ